MRYRWIGASGEEISRESLADFCHAVRNGEITAETLVKVGEDGRWLPAGRHPDVASVLSLLRIEAEHGVSRAPAPEQAPVEQPRVEQPPVEILPPDAEEEIVDAVIRPPTMPIVVEAPLGEPASVEPLAMSTPPIDRPVRPAQSVAINSAFPLCWKLAIAGFIGVTAIDIACYVFTDQMNVIARGHGQMAFWNAIGNIRIGLFVIGGLAYMFAVPAAHEFLTAHGYKNFKIRPWVANVCLFVPLAGLVVPWMYWGDVRRESARLADHGPFGDALPPQRKFSGAALGVGLTFFLYAAGVGAVNSVMQSAKSLAAIQDAGHILIGLDVLFFGALWLYFRGISDLWRIGLVQPRVRRVETMA